MKMLMKSQDNNLRKRKNSAEDNFDTDIKNNNSLKSNHNKNHVEHIGSGEKYRVVHLSGVIWLCFGLLVGEYLLLLVNFL